MPFLPLILGLVPELARWMGGARAGAVTDAVADAVRAIAGSDDPAAVRAAMDDPVKATDLRVRLAEIAAEQDRAERQADLDEFRAEIADLANARQQTVSLAQSGSPLAWGAPIVTLAVFVIVGGTLYALFGGSLPDSQMAMVLVGAVAAWGGQAVAYWLGSSASSRAKDTTIREAAENLAHSAPVDITRGR